MRNMLASAITLATLLPLGTQAATLEERVEALETELIVTEEALADANYQLEHNTNISGYVDVEYSMYKDKPGSKDGFRLHHANFMILKKFDEQWDFYSEIEFENGPEFEADDIEIDNPALATDISGELEGNGAILVEKVGFDYKWRPEVTVRMGRFITPTGIWNEEHYTPFVPTQVIPMHIRQIYPTTTDGIGIIGTVPIDSSFMKYNVYSGNGRGNGGGGDGNSSKAFGARVAFVIPSFQHLEAGLSLYEDTDNDNVEVSASGLHLRFREGPWSLQMEYSQSDEDDAGSVTEQEGMYIQPIYRTGKWSFGYRYDVYDSDAGAATQSETETNSLFVNYRVTPNIVLKAEHHMYSYENPATVEDEVTMLSAAVFLGN